MSLLHYVTYKYIIIKDKRLGIAYYCLAAAILLYTTVQIFVNKAYLQYDLSPRGNVRIIVTTPPTKVERDRPLYCCNNTDQKCTACRALDGLSLNWPVESRAVTIASYVKERWEKQNCNENVYDQANGHSSYSIASVPLDSREKDYFSLYPEDALIKIEHSVSALDNQFSSSHRMMNGQLMGIDGAVVKRFDSQQNSGVNKIWLKDFLTAANVSLDDDSDALNANGRTYRQNGLVLHVLIDYRNAENSFIGTEKPTYTYKIQHVTFSDYRVRQEIPIPYSNGTICERLVNKRYGVRLEFTQIGKIGQFCSSNLIFQLVSLMGLLTLTATIIDCIALYLVPNKEMYRQYVFDSSPDLRKQLKDEREESTEEKVKQQ